MVFTTASSRGLAGETESYVRVGVTPRLELGAAYLWRPGRVRPLVSVALAPERGERPAVTVGHMSDLSGGREKAFFTLTRSVRPSPSWSLSLYGGAAKTYDSGSPQFIAGVLAQSASGPGLSVQFDGRYPHVGLNTVIARTAGGSVRAGVLVSRGRYWGPMVATTFALR